MMRFLYVTYCTSTEVRTTGGIKQVEMHNRSENGRGACVALCAHPTHADSDTEINTIHTHIQINLRHN
jgi:hypothetical protein